MAGSPSRTEAEGIMDGKIEELEKEKITLKTSITKLLNELAAELSTQTPNKENVTAILQDIDKRRDELLELLDSLRTLYGENKHAPLAASTGDEADKIIDRVDNETKKLGFSYRKVTARKAKEITQARSAHLRAHNNWQRWSRGRCKQTARVDSNPKVFGGQERLSVVVGSVFKLCG